MELYFNAFIFKADNNCYVIEDKGKYSFLLDEGHFINSTQLKNGISLYSSIGTTDDEENVGVDEIEIDSVSNTILETSIEESGVRAKVFLYEVRINKNFEQNSIFVLSNGFMTKLVKVDKDDLLKHPFEEKFSKILKENLKPKKLNLRETALINEKFCDHKTAEKINEVRTVYKYSLDVYDPTNITVYKNKINYIGGFEFTIQYKNRVAKNINRDILSIVQTVAPKETSKFGEELLELNYQEIANIEKDKNYISPHNLLKIFKMPINYSRIGVSYNYYHSILPIRTNDALYGKVYNNFIYNFLGEAIYKMVKQYPDSKRYIYDNEYFVFDDGEIAKKAQPSSPSIDNVMPVKQSDEENNNADGEEKSITSVPFPQANDFSKIVLLAENLFEVKIIQKSDICKQFEFDSRQGDYYANALLYLGIVDIKGKDIILNEYGKTFLSMNRNINDAMIDLVKEHIVFKKVYNLEIKNNVRMCNKDIVSLMKKYKTFNMNSENTYMRRASTVRKWLDYIYENEQGVSKNDFYEKFEKFALQSKFNYSYKLVLLLSYFEMYRRKKIVNFRLDDIATLYIKFYVDRLEAGKIIDKEGTTYNLTFLKDKKSVLRNIIDNPLQAYLNSGYMTFNKEMMEVSLVDDLANIAFENNIIEKLENRLKTYYEDIDKNCNDASEKSIDSNRFYPILHSTDFKRVVFLRNNVFYLVLPDWKNIKYNIVDYQFNLEQYRKNGNLSVFTMDEIERRQNEIDNIVEFIKDESAYISKAEEEYNNLNKKELEANKNSLQECKNKSLI